MTKLEQVRKALENNSQIVITDVGDRNYLPERDPYGWSHTVDFFTAPASDDVYNKAMSTIDVFQSLLLSIVPELKPDSIDKFKEWDDRIEFGKLDFNETIGLEKLNREITITSNDIPSLVINGKLIIIKDEVLRRRIWVRLFPSISMARDAFKKGENLNQIHKIYLPSYGVQWRTIDRNAG